MTRGSLAHWVEWVLPWVVMGGNEKLGKPPNVRAVRRMVLGIDERIDGVNLGNWLVLEKWMNPALFDGTTADDEYYLPTQLDPAVYEARIKTHRAEYINERDSATIKSWGLNSVRIPVPYFIFGDRAPFIGCIDELDKAFN